MAKQLVCTLCGYAGSPKKKTKGNFLIEVILWLCFIIPGLIYSLWRISDKQEICPKCGNASMIPQDTPQGQKLMSQQPGVPQMATEQLATQNSNNRRNLLVVAGVLFVILFVPVIIGMSISKNKAPSNTESVVQPAEQKAAPMVQSNLSTEPQARIEALVKSVGDYEVTVWDLKSNPAKPTTKPPYEVIVNAGNGKIASCYYAKNIVTDIMKKLYTDEITKDKITRVLFTSWGNLKVSLGSEDGSKIDWATAGPTNFWTVMIKYKPYEDETGTLSQRTWGKAIANDCN